MENKNLVTIKIIAENKPGVLYRITGQFLRRKINVESLNTRKIDPVLSEVLITGTIPESQTNNFVLQLKRIIEVRGVVII